MAEQHVLVIRNARIVTPERQIEGDLAVQGVGLALSKHVLARRAAIAHSTLRKPGAAPNPATAAEIDRIRVRQALKLAALGLPAD